MMPKAAIINIGDEILIGQISNTNAGFIAHTLDALSFQVKQIVAVADNKKEIIAAIKRMKAYDLLIITGGLGITNDDITISCLCQYLDKGLVLNQATLDELKKRYGGKTDADFKNFQAQSMIPEGSERIQNKIGTAPGIWAKKDSQHIIVLPGVPRQMEKMLSEEVAYRLCTLFPDRIYRKHIHILTGGLKEPLLANRLSAIEKQLPNHISLAYLPDGKIVRLRLSAQGNDKKKVDNELEQFSAAIIQALKEYYIACTTDALSKVVFDQLKKLNISIALAESCSGGAVSKQWVKHSGASAVFKGAIIAYDDRVKMGLLNVSQHTLDQFGAVSKECAKAMLEGVLSSFDVTMALSITGWMEKNKKGNPEIFIALGDGKKIRFEHHELYGDRTGNLKSAVQLALLGIWKFIIKLEKDKKQ